MKVYSCQQLGDPIETWRLFYTWAEARDEYESVSQFYTSYLIKEYDSLELIQLLQQKIFDLKDPQD